MRRALFRLAGKMLLSIVVINVVYSLSHDSWTLGLDLIQIVRIHERMDDLVSSVHASVQQIVDPFIPLLRDLILRLNK